MSEPYAKGFRPLTWERWMVVALVCVAVVLGIYPADRTVWCVEMVWAVWLWAILLLTRRKDILCDTFGAICSSGLFLWYGRRALTFCGDNR